MDAGNFCHWIIFNIGADTTGLAEDMPKTGEPGNGVKQGTNGWGTLGWGGPAPPPGTGRHRYYFRLYALHTTLSLPAGAGISQVREAIQDYILDTAEIMGTYISG
jgi:Raf kinase inhibitor-like YbhB/YbcL family protein